MSSITSDGIPIADEYLHANLQGDNAAHYVEEKTQKYNWNSDISPESLPPAAGGGRKEEEPPASSSSSSSGSSFSLGEASDGEDYNDDLELLPPVARVPSGNDLSTGYPHEELPPEFAEAKVISVQDNASMSHLQGTCERRQKLIGQTFRPRFNGAERTATNATSKSTGS